MMTTDQSTSPSQTCPTCGERVPVNPRYVNWCDCGWNVAPSQKQEQKNIIERLYLKFSEKSGEKLYQKIRAELAAGHPLKPVFTLSKLAAYICAGFVYLLSLILVISGIIFIFKIGQSFFLFLFGVFLLGMGWISRPRFPKLEGELISPEKYPEVYSMVKAIADKMGARIDGIVINEQYNAAFSRVGWRGKYILYLGLPLLSVLGNAERVALIAHEMAHSVNKDCSRGIFIGTAVTTLSEWYEVIMPGRIFDIQSILHILMLPFLLVIWSFAKLIWGFIFILSLLIWRESQRAEYYADRLAIDIGGREGMIGLLEKLHLQETFRVTVQQTALNQGMEFFSSLKENITRVPEREKERLRKVKQLEGSRIDATHPSTVFRVQLAQQTPVTEPGFVLTDLESARIDEELKPLREKSQQILVNNYFDSIY